MCPFRSKEYK
jgi:hypothetical protein